MSRTRSTRPAARALTVATVATTLGALMTGCSSAESSSAAGSPTLAAPTLELTHVHGAAYDPGDGALLLATHQGLLAVADGVLTPMGPVIDLMGFTVAGPDRYLASGHPGLHVDLPQPVGLIETTDGGRTWTPLSRQGQSDFHALTVGDTGVLGDDGTLIASPDKRPGPTMAPPGSSTPMRP